MTETDRKLGDNIEQMDNVLRKLTNLQQKPQQQQEEEDVIDEDEGLKRMRHHQ